MQENRGEAAGADTPGDAGPGSGDGRAGPTPESPSGMDPVLEYGTAWNPGRYPSDRSSWESSDAILTGSDEVTTRER